jgi:hypothetical protein
MPVDPASFRYKHLVLPSDYTETEKYKITKTGFPQEFKLFLRDRQTHHDMLVTQFRTIEKEIAESDNRREAMGISGFDGITVTFKGEPDYKLKHESLDLKRYGIKLLNVQTIVNETIATVFILEGKIGVFIGGLEKHASEKSKITKLFAI